MNTLPTTKKILFLLIMISIIIFSLALPYNTHNLDKLAYAIALGLDVGENNNLKLTIQFSKTKADSSGSSNSYNKVIDSVECSSIDSGISIFNTSISRKVNLAHCKVVVISEDLAINNKISDSLYTLVNNVGMNSHAGIIISKIPADEFLNSANPPLEEIESRYYENTLESNKYTGYARNISLLEFFSDTMDSFTEPIAMLGSIRNSPQNSSTNISNMGFAVFKSDKLIGELSPQEAIFHNIVCNHLKSCTITIPNPLKDSYSIDVQLKPSKRTKNTVTFINGNPYISSEIYVKAKIISATNQSTFSNNNYYSNGNSKLIEETCNKYLEKYITKYLYKTSKEFKSDINGFGKSAVKYFPSVQEWEKYNWLRNYENSIFNVNVTTSLKSGYTFL